MNGCAQRLHLATVAPAREISLMFRLLATALILTGLAVPALADDKAPARLRAADLLHQRRQAD